jgi:hypothetical protein
MNKLVFEYKKNIKNKYIANPCNHMTNI